MREEHGLAGRFVDDGPDAWDEVTDAFGVTFGEPGVDEDVLWCVVEEGVVDVVLGEPVGVAAAEALDGAGARLLPPDVQDDVLLGGLGLAVEWLFTHDPGFYTRSN